MNRLSPMIAAFVLALVLLPWSANVVAGDATETAKRVLDASGVKGGLVVHVPCDDAALTAALRAGDSYVVQGLARSRGELEGAREAIRKKGGYGPVSVDLLSGRSLPYIDNSVNMLVLSDPGAVDAQEAMRVLVPGGVAVVVDADGAVLRVTRKPRPANIDEWTHYMHDPSNNAVAHDTAIQPLRHLQWDGSPRYSRHHEFTSSVAAMVSAGGRLFSIMDMGSRASIHMPAKWQLTARDAFNGIVLWQRPIESWFTHLWPLKDGPAQPPRRLVAVGDSVYVTLGIDAPVSRLDAATGEVLHTYEGTEFTEEILFIDGTLVLLKGDRSMNPKDYHPKLMVCWDEVNRTVQRTTGYLLKPEPRHVLVMDADSGSLLWKTTSPVEPLTLTADETNVYFHNWKDIVCLDRKTGAKRWESGPAAPREDMEYRYGPTLVAYGDVVLFADGRKERKIHSFSKKDGTLLWQAPHYPAGHAGSPEDLMVVDGLVWCGNIAGGRSQGVFTGRDPVTGEVKREFTPNVRTYWFHHRCHRSKATDNFILTSRTGIEFVDVRNQTWEAHHWVRGACTYGILPCNGLIYAPPHPCACYLETKLSGLSALAPASQRNFGEPIPTEERLEKGPAYGESAPSSAVAAEVAADWPTYRHDAGRSGATTTELALPLSRRWETKLSGRLTAPVVAEGQVYVASQEAHTVYALDATTGKIRWSYTTGGPVDSPPTIHRGLVIFGSADGKVYCLRAVDGEIVWRFTAAPREARLVSYGQIESVWPVHGSVLVENEKVYCIAGRSTFLDGGLHFYCLEASTGNVVTEKVLFDQKNPQEGVNVLNMPVALTDILSSDGKRLYLLSQVFDLDGNRVRTVDPSSEPVDRATMQLGEDAHLFSPTGFLDDQAWHRSYWLYGRAFSSGCNWWFRAGRYAPAGRMLVYDRDHVYGFGREPGLFVWSHVLENHIFCAAKQADPEAIAAVKKWSNQSGRDAIFNRQFTRQASPTQRTAPTLQWSVRKPPLHARAVVLAKNALLLAGPPDVLDEDDAFNRPFDPDVKAKIALQDAAYQGKKGALLLALSPDSGEIMAQRELASPPVWDGMAVAGGRLIIVRRDGTVQSLGNR